MPETVVHGRYSIRSTLGSGGMARVYLAHDGVLGRDVAIKVLRDQYAEDAEFAERFKREARSAASLSHPNIVSIYDRGVDEDGTSYIAMEHVPGGSLKERISREGVLDTPEAASVALKISNALEEAHGRGVIHRDIKPHNVLLTSTGDVKVADFGIARASAYTAISQTSLVLGTAGYMSPEQALGEPVDPRSDLYSLGVVLYEMLTGGLPFTADNPVAVSMKHVNEPLRPPREINPEITEDMDAVVTKLLAKKPGDRYGGATELAEDLRRVRDGMPPLAAGPVGRGTNPEPPRVETRRPVPSPPPAYRTNRRRRRRSTPWVLAAVLLLLVLLGGLGWALSQSGNNGNPGNRGNGSSRVPSVIGLPQDQAQQRLDGAGFRPEVERRESTEEETGTVLNQSPGGETRARNGSPVTLQVGSGPSGPATVAVPEVSNMSLPEAEAALGNAGLAVGNVREIQRNDVAPGVVVEQGYQVGVPVAPGTAINLGVSVEPPAPAPETPNQDTPTPAPQEQQQEQQQEPQPQQPQPQEPQQEQPQQEQQEEPLQEPQQEPPQQEPPQEEPQRDLGDEIQDEVREGLEDAGDDGGEG